MVIQIPVFFALYKVIFITIEMRHAPFFGWIKDLSAPDPTNVFTLFGLIPWDPTALPMFGHFLALGIWPLIMGFSMFLQMKMNPEPADPVQKSMFAWMPVIFTFMLGTFPAGLVIYWTWNNTLTVLQQYYIMTKAGVKVELWDNLTKMFAQRGAGEDAERMSDVELRAGLDGGGTKAVRRPLRFLLRRGAARTACRRSGAPEIAFAGRSNVGKSSLINALTGRTGLARASHTPGRTQELIFFDLDGRRRWSTCRATAMRRSSKRSRRPGASSCATICAAGRRCCASSCWSTAAMA